MVWPKRPRFVLFGSSIVQLSFLFEGWGAILATRYSRQADVILRGYSGWNSRKAMQVLDEVFPKGEEIQPSLVIVYFGGNDSHKPLPDGSGSHVPLPEFVDNMRKIATHLKSLSEETEIIFATAPPVNVDQMLQFYPDPNHDFQGRTNELLREYGNACIKLCQEMGIKYIDLFDAFKRQNDWLTSFFDGVHLAARGSMIVWQEIDKILKDHEIIGNLPEEFESMNSKMRYINFDF